MVNLELVQYLKCNVWPQTNQMVCHLHGKMLFSLDPHFTLYIRRSFIHTFIPKIIFFSVEFCCTCDAMMFIWTSWDRVRVLLMRCMLFCFIFVCFCCYSWFKFDIYVYPVCFTCVTTNFLWPLSQNTSTKIAPTLL